MSAVCGGNREWQWQWQREMKVEVKVRRKTQVWEDELDGKIEMKV